MAEQIGPTVINIKRSPKPKPGKTAKQAEAQPAAPDDQVGVVLLIVFTVDGQPVINVPLASMMARPPADATQINLQIGLDARKVLQALEPHLGPSRASVARLVGPNGEKLA